MGVRYAVISNLVTPSAERDLFKKAVVDMFGSEARIPESVKKTMLLCDYGDRPVVTNAKLAQSFEA